MSASRRGVRRSKPASRTSRAPPTQARRAGELARCHRSHRFQSGGDGAIHVVEQSPFTSRTEEARPDVEVKFMRASSLACRSASASGPRATRSRLSVSCEVHWRQSSQCSAGVSSQRQTLAGSRATLDFARDPGVERQHVWRSPHCSTARKRVCGIREAHGFRPLPRRHHDRAALPRLPL